MTKKEQRILAIKAEIRQIRLEALSDKSQDWLSKNKLFGCWAGKQSWKGRFWKYVRDNVRMVGLRIFWKFSRPSRLYTEGFPKLGGSYSAMIEEKYDRWPADLRHVTDEEYFPTTKKESDLW